MFFFKNIFAFGINCVDRQFYIAHLNHMMYDLKPRKEILREIFFVGYFITTYNGGLLICS
jgi:hypothetical protein